MSNNFDAHNATNRARDIRGAYMNQSLFAMVKAAFGALDALAIKAPLAGHRA